MTPQRDLFLVSFLILFAYYLLSLAFRPRGVPA